MARRTFTYVGRVGSYCVMAAISTARYNRLKQQIGVRCGYCRTSSVLIARPLTVEHLIPRSKGGTSDEQNLWLSCRSCNQFKGTQIEAIDPDTKMVVPLFNPRIQSWSEHFRWSTDGLMIIGLTPVGRATVIALKLNHEHIVESRRLWVSVGWHPPK